VLDREPLLQLSGAGTRICGRLTRGFVASTEQCECCSCLV
jgi:hypothetical protein